MLPKWIPRGVSSGCRLKEHTSICVPLSKVPRYGAGSGDGGGGPVTAVIALAALFAP